ncbi:succinate dehydrogenase subunit 7, mitochondrial-like [Typha angustifolia]|uniref:succinate dehydrogenase subunit 7, mitochondrial-like n=1 Tax=Typha angustifolia TaxID=59011 RepID=UPI003C2CEB08
MAVSYSKTTLFSILRQNSQNSQRPLPNLPRRDYHIELGVREKALLEEDPALKRFKSYKNNVKQATKIGTALTVLVVAACSYEIYAVATAKN